MGKRCPGCGQYRHGWLILRLLVDLTAVFTVTAPRSSSGLKKRRFRILPWDVDDILAPLLLGVIGSRSVGFRLNHLPLGNISKEYVYARR